MFRSPPDHIHLGHSGVVGDQPVSTLIDQYDRVRIGGLAEVPRDFHRGPSEVVRRGLDVGHVERKRQDTAKHLHTSQVVVDSSSFVGAESWGDDVGFVRGGNVWVGEAWP
jgi:hypothetical protein